MPFRISRAGLSAQFTMPQGLSHAFAYLLLIVHAGLGGWALMGFSELFLPEVPWTRLSNPLFSPRMLFLQWLLVAAAGAVFIVGYVRRWPHTPRAMLILYSAMALVCAYQTFFILTNASRYAAMAVEYAEYGLILLFLFGSSHARHRFGRDASQMS